jgi:FkbM family methyltransferase
MTVTDFGIAIVDGDSHLSKWILEQRKLDVDGSAHEMASRFIKPGDTVIDGGALLGDHTIVYLNAVGPNGTVHAFEPNRIAMECLIHNCPQAILWSIALGSKDGWGIISNGEGNRNLGAAMVLPGLEVSGSILVQSLDSLEFPRLDFMKLDIEGMELDALLGGKETLKRCRPVVMAEINHGILKERGIDYGEIFRLMHGLGYRSELRDPRYGLDQLQTDVLFIPL